MHATFVSTLALLLLAASSSLAAPATAGKKYIANINNSTSNIVVDIMLDFTTSDQPKIMVNQTTVPAGTNYKWHLHKLDVSSSSTCDTTGGHYDPTNKAPGGNYTVAPSSADKTTYEVGDLSGKHGVLKSDNNTQNWTIVDTTLPGADTWDVKSIVIHNATSGAKIACANLTDMSLKQLGSGAASAFATNWMLSGLLGLGALMML
ncbi:hypothetical protein BKA69DRAFT_1081919 [Paraphysoderma sedebokerense]|nr:hypothetical protein BKA69DRAFT_1081919 [Paraphysoderma sedebokerense]